ncbi:MAG: DUF3341 domain-containing protein [Anaerolineales bacterium]|nr:DUF3341 domain-containing protein [Anaerolineales bacterium]
MTETVNLLAVFPDLEPASDAVEQLRLLGVTDDHMNVISGVPVTEPMLGRPHAWTNVPRIAFGGAILGMCGALFLIFIVPYLYPYPIQVGPQAYVPGPPSFILLFEITMLGMLLSTFLGVWLESFFPNYRPLQYLPEISDGKFVVYFSCPEASQDKFTKTMTALGAEKVTLAEARQL